MRHVKKAEALAEYGQRYFESREQYHGGCGNNDRPTNV